MNEDRQAKSKRTLRVSRSAMPSDGRRFPWLLGWLLGLGILALFGILAVRMQGTQQLLTERLARRLGVDVSVDSVRIGWPYDLVFSGLMFADPDALAATTAEPLLSLDELRLGWRGGRGLAIRVRRGQLSLNSGDDGRPGPLRWAALADMEDAGALSDWLLTTFGDDVRFCAEQMTVAWRGADGRLLMRAENVNWFSVPVRVPRRRWRYFELAADRVMRADGSDLTGLRYEWLISGELTLIELGHRVAGEQAGVPLVPAPSEPQPHVERENI